MADLVFESKIPMGLTENEYTHLLTLYYSGNYCLCMEFHEFVTRYAKKILRGENNEVPV